MRGIILTCLIAIVGGSAAQASTPQSWSQLERRVNRACVAMSGLARPELLATKLSFSDAIGIEGRMLRGPDNRGRMKRVICAYDRRTGRAEVAEASNWNAPAVKP